MYTLALETSCDETSAAVLQDGRTICSNIISTQVPIHRKFGGVVPEIASRQHIEYVLPIIKKALDTAQVTLSDIDHIGVTYGPGLVGTPRRRCCSESHQLCYRYSSRWSQSHGRPYFC